MNRLFIFHELACIENQPPSASFAYFKKCMQIITDTSFQRFENYEFQTRPEIVEYNFF